MDNNLLLFYKGAHVLGLPVTYLPHLEYLNINLGRKNYYFSCALTPLNKGASIFIARNKFRLNKLLDEAGFPVPKAVAFNADERARQPLSDLIQGLQFPLAAKPMKGTGRGMDVLCNIQDITLLSEHVSRILKKHSYIQIEEFHQHLKEYRVLVLKNQVIGVVERFGACVIGDGEHSIEELIVFSNRERAMLALNLTISPLVVDEEYLLCLSKQNLSLQSIPPKGKKVRLCYTANTGRGGDILSHGKKIHPKNVNYLCRAAKTIGLTYVGFDVLCEDINLPFSRTKWLILEANQSPDTTIHEVPHRGKRSSVVKKVLRQLIFRHPLSYIVHLCTRSRWSIYIKMSSSVGILFVVIRYLT